MARPKIMASRKTLFAAIERMHHEELRMLAHLDRRSIADLVRQSIVEFLERRRKRAGGKNADR